MFKVILIAVLLSNVVSLSDVTYYEILGVSKQATTKEIKQAYKKLAIRLHPDKNPEADQEKFLKITEAYETLKDPDKRHKYDVYGSYPTYTKKYDYRSQAEYNNLYYNGLYHEDPFVDTLSGGSFNNYLQEEGFHFINFYSPFCPPCQNLVDHWKKLAEVYKGIIKVGAVNCKHYNNFCYNSMRIGSYPSLLFYPHGKKGNFIYYRGDRTFESLENFVMSYLNSRINVPVISQIKSTDKPIAYVLGARRIEENALTRIAYQLRNIVTLVIVEDDTLRAKLTDNDYTTVVFKFRSTSKEIEGTEEKDILKEIVTALPKFETIDPEKFKKIRNQLRTDHKTPWLLYFSSEDNYRDVLLLHQMTVSHPKMNFGEIDCSRWPELCASLQCAGGGWAVLKAGGALQRAAPGLAAAAAAATALHSLAAGELARVLHGATGTWVLAIVPYKLSWDHILQPFMRASLHYTDSDDVSFGIMECTMHNEEVCRQVVTDQPGIIVQVGHNRHYYNGRINEGELVDFIELLRDSDDLELSEQQVLEILDAGREHTWLVAFLPAHCRRTCDALLHQWRIVARKLRPLERVRVGALRCGPQSGGFCNNVRSPTARLYPLASGYHYTVSLEHLAEAPYMLEWALEYIDDSVLKLNWHSFSKQVIAEELKPSSSGSKPWLVYFHSPRCYRCYEMYADFAITGILLNNAVHLGKVNCINERGLCQHEQVTSYPSLKLYLKRNQQNRFSSVITIPVKDYATMLPVIKPHLQRYDPNLLAGIDDNLGIKSRSFHINHDEF